MTTDGTPAAPAADTTPAVPTDPAALAARDQELTALYEHDPNRYAYEDGGKHANEHAALRKAQQTKSAEPADTADDDVDVSAIDLDAPVADADDPDDDEAGEGAEAQEASVKRLGPGDDASDEELDAWRAEHGIPDDPAGYEPPKIDDIVWDTEALSPILEAVHAHNVPAQAVADALAKYGERIQAQRAQINQRNADLAKALREEFSKADIDAVKSAAQAMPADLRKALNQAILPDGTRLLNQPEVLRMIAGYGAKGQNTPLPRDSRTMLKQELAELETLRNRDIDAYNAQYRNTGRSGSDRALEIMRELGSEAPAKPSAADLKAEERELRQLRDADPKMFEFGNWRGSGRPASDRLVALQSGRF